MNKAAVLIAALLAAIPLQGQDAPSLSQFFEGKQVVVKIDMPGSQQGIDIYPQKDNMLDAKAYGKRMKSFPIALHNGDAVMVTTVKVKDKSIEFQLGGGGFGTFGDDTDTSVKFTPAPKSDREKDLENQLANTDDQDQKDRIQRELDYLRRQRERDDQRNQAIAQQAARVKQMQVNDDRMKSGSRFNLKYDGKVPPNTTPQDVMAALSQFVSFPPGMTGGSPAGAQAGTGRMMPVATAAPAKATAPATVNGLQKGMHQDQVRSLLGNPTGSADTDHDGLQVHSRDLCAGKLAYPCRVCEWRAGEVFHRRALKRVSKADRFRQQRVSAYSGKPSGRKRYPTQGSVWKYCLPLPLSSFRRSWPIRGAQMEVLLAAATFELSPELADKDAQIFGLMSRLRTPDGGEQRPVGEHLSGITCEMQQQVKFFRREVDCLA